MNLTYLEIDKQRADYELIRSQRRNDFEERLALSWVFHDHALEGVVLTQEDLNRAVNEMPVRNYCDGRTHASLRRLLCLTRFLHESAAAGEDVSLAWLKEVHAKLCDPCDESAGRYRKRDSSPGVYNLNVSSAATISYHLRKFLDLYENELKDFHPIRTAAFAHWEFMKVFPFDERTGVVGRLMMNFILIRNGYPPAIIHAMDRHHYFAALDGHRSDLVPVLTEAIMATLSAAECYQRQSRRAG
jgi:Fic family protein